MKWLILLALVASCGKHTQPKAVDLHDSDGDQIHNYEESDFDKYVANFESLSEVKGVLRVFTDKQRELSFSNKYDLEKRTMEMITGNEKQLRPEEYFSEWSKIKFQDNNIEFLQSQYVVTLDFETGSDKPDEVVLISGNKRTLLAPWSPQIELKLSGQTLKDLQKGNAEIAMVKKFERSMSPGQDSNKTIKEKTYRVYYNEGSSSKVYYVSKDLNFEDFLGLKKVHLAVGINEDLIFFESQTTSGETWFYREMENGDKVVVKSNRNELREIFLKRFEYKKTTIGRENGISKGVLNLQNKKEAKIYLRVRSFYKTKRTFVETTEVRGGGGGGREGNAAGRCKIHRRLIENESVEYLNLENFAFEIMTPETFVQDRVEVTSDDLGTYWDMKVDARNPNSALKFKSLPANSYLATGEISSSCDYMGSMQKTNPEGKLSLEVESYVEKIEE